MENMKRILKKTATWLLDSAEVNDPVPALPGSRIGETGGPPVDILALDVSPSMALKDYTPSRLDGAKRAAKRFVREKAKRSPESLVGLVSYCRRAKLEVDPRPLCDASNTLVRRIDGLTTCLSTNIAAGLKVSDKTIRGIRNRGDSRVLLLTDGEHNVGPDSDVKEQARELKKAGIQLDIIGIGGSPSEVDEALLKSIASVVDGQTRYWFIESVPELVKRFEALALRETK